MGQDVARVARYVGKRGFRSAVLCVAHHTDGQRHTDVTVGTCWDSDRWICARRDTAPPQVSLYRVGV